MFDLHKERETPVLGSTALVEREPSFIASQIWKQLSSDKSERLTVHTSPLFDSHSVESDNEISGDRVISSPLKIFRVRETLAVVTIKHRCCYGDLN